MRAIALLTCIALGAPVGALATTMGPLQSLAVGPTSSEQRQPTLSWDPVEQNYVLVFQEDRGGATGTDIMAVRLTAGGMLRDPQGCAIVTGAHRSGAESQPALAYNPSDRSHVVAWTEARNAIANIHMARFRASVCVADRGLQVTPVCNPSVPNTCNTDGFSSIAVGPNTVWATFQTNFPDQLPQVRLRRYTPQLAPLDPEPIALAMAALRPAAIALGRGAVVAFDAETDVFIRTVPAIGPVPSPMSAVRVSAAPLSQSRARLSALGTSLLVAWQDGRRGVMGEDIYARQFDLTLAPNGLSFPVAEHSAALLAPVIAGDFGGGFAVWQDRRNGAFNSIVYGTELETSTGAARGLTFPIVALAGNAFEPTVARGPTSDFMVAAVRFGTPSRIYYRIVRDEDPAGVLNAPPDSVPADGMTRAILTFADAVGPSGFKVVDGTQYTLTLRPQGGATILQNDADPNRAGHQVIATSGRVRVSLVSSQVGMVHADLVSVQGTAAGTGQATFDSAAPVATQVLLSPVNPTTLDDLQLSYRYEDSDGDPEAGTSIQWTRNTLVQSAYDDRLQVPASATQAGDSWRALVVPSDGANFGEPTFSNILVILNSGPEASDVRITPAENVTTRTVLRLGYRYQDPDRDPEDGTLITWRLNGVAQSDLQGAEQVPADRVLRGQVWQAGVQPKDGQTFGVEVLSNEVHIQNSPPTAVAGSDQRVMEGDRVQLDGTASFDPDTQDSLRFSWRLADGPTLSDSTSPTPSFLAPAGPARLVLELRVSDGTIVSQPDTVEIEVQARPVMNPDAGVIADSGSSDTGEPVDAGPVEDGGLECSPLPDNTECCTVCAGGSVVVPVCQPEGQAGCPAEADLCIVGACSQPGSLAIVEDGCSCSSATGIAHLPGLWLGLGLLFRRRRT